MATIGNGILQKAAFDFFDALRSYDVKRAAANLDEGATFRTPWTDGLLVGKGAIESHLTNWLGNAKSRPTLSLGDVAGDGAVLRMRLAVSGRFGQAPTNHEMTVLCLKDKVHQVDVA